MLPPGDTVTKPRCSQLYWPSARATYAALVEAEDAARPPYTKSVRYKKDAVCEWGYFDNAHFHTATGDARPVKRITLAETAVPTRASQHAAKHVTNGMAVEPGVDQSPDAERLPEAATSAAASARSPTSEVAPIGRGTDQDEPAPGRPAKRLRLELNSAAQAAAEDASCPRACAALQMP